MSGVTLIKIGDIVDPRTFWAHENKKLSKSNLKLRSMESRLKESVSGLGAPLTIPRPGSGVAVRHEDRWVRGRLEHVFRLKKMTATVFLIDYGVTVRDIVVADDVRSLEQQFLIQPPLAFQVILSGLYPLSMSMEWVENNTISDIIILYPGHPLWSLPPVHEHGVGHRRRRNDGPWPRQRLGPRRL